MLPHRPIINKQHSKQSKRAQNLTSTTEETPERQFVVRFLGHRFGITCHSTILDKIDAKTLLTLIIDDTQQQQHRDDPEKVFKNVILALSRLQAAQKIQASITHVHKANLDNQ